MKKTFLILTLILTFNYCYSEDFQIGNELVKGNLIYSSESCVIIESKDENGNPLYWILSEVANAVLPSVSREICLKIMGENNTELCDNVANGIDFITSLVGTGSKTYKLIRETIKLTAEKGLIKSSLHFVTNSLDLANNAKSTLEAYKKLGIINWNNVSKYLGVENVKNYFGSVTFENKTNKNFIIELSKDGVNWISFVVKVGGYIKKNIWNGYFNQDYGFIRGNSLCNYQIFTNKTYRLRYDNITKTNYIE